MFKKLLSLILLPFAIATISDCGSDGDLAKITYLSQDPVDPKVGDNLTIELDYELSEVVTKGTATYDVTLNFIPFTPSVEDLCTEQAANDPCPLEVGLHQDKSSSVVPSGVSGLITTKVTWKDDQDRQILCYKIGMSL